MRFTWETLSLGKDFRMYSLHWEENVKWLNAGKHKCYPQTKLAQAQGPLLGEVVKTNLKFSFSNMSVRPPWKPWIRSVLPLLGVQTLKIQGEKNHSFYWDVSHNCCSQGIRWHSYVNVAIEKLQQTSWGQCSAIASSIIRHLGPHPPPGPTEGTEQNGRTPTVSKDPQVSTGGWEKRLSKVENKSRPGLSSHTVKI